MMANPWVLLGLVLFWAASMGGAYYKGHTAAQDAARAHYATELEATIKEHNENALIDAQAAREAGERDAKAKVRTVTITNTVEKVLHDTPSPANCRLSPDAFGLLVAAVKVANGTDTDAAGAVPSAIPATRASR